MFSDDRLTNKDVEELLSESAAYIDYPPAPNFAGGLRRELTGSDRAANDHWLHTNDAFTAPSRASRTLWQAPTEISEAAPDSRDWRQAVRIVAVGAVLLVVGLIVVFLLREIRRESSQVATPNRSELREVFISTFSDSTGPNDFYSYLLIRDAATLETIYTIPVDLGGWFTISRDGTHLYAAGDHYLTSMDTRTGRTVWEVPIFGRHLRELGVPGLAEPAVSPDGTRLYLYRTTESGLTYWIEEIDAVTGETIRVSSPSPNPSSGCNALMYPSPDGKSLYLPCRDGRVVILDLSMMQWVDPLDFTPLISAAQPADGKLLYAVSDMGEIAVIDMDARQIVERAQFVDLAAEDEYSIMASATISNDGETLAVILTDDVVRGPVLAYQYRLYDVGSWEEVNRIAVEEPIIGGGLTPDHEGGFLIVAQDGEEPIQLDRDGLEPVGYSLGDDADANYHRTVAATIATGESATFVCPVTPQTTDTEIRERYGFGSLRTIEVEDTYVNFWAPSKGEGVGYTRRHDDSDGREEGGWHYLTVLLIPAIESDIEVSGYRLDAAGDLRFGESDNPDVTSEGRSEPGRDGSGLVARQRIGARVQGPGCYGMVIQWDERYETVVFEVVE